MGFAALGLIGAGVSAIGSVASGVAQGDAASYNAQVANNNAIIARQNATYAEQAGNAKVEQAGIRASEQMGGVKTALAANNVDVNTGSAVDVETGTREEGALNQFTIANNAELQAYGYRAQATGFESEAGLDEAQAEYDPIAGAVGGFGSLLSNTSAIGLKNWPGSNFTAFGSGDSGLTTPSDSTYLPGGQAGVGTF